MLIGREWPLTRILTGELDQTFFDELEGICGQSLDCIPEEAKIVNTNALCFKLSSRQGCYHYEFMSEPHTLPPYNLLATVYKPETAAGVVAQCPKLRDSYTEGFIKHFPDITSYWAVLELCIVVLMGKTNTSRIESLNALLRRIIAMRYQSRPYSFVEVCSKFGLCRARITRRMLGSPVHSKARKTRRDKRQVTNTGLEKTVPEDRSLSLQGNAARA